MAGKNGRSDHCILVKKKNKEICLSLIIAICIIKDIQISLSLKNYQLVNLSTRQLVNLSTNLLVNFHSLARRIFHHVHALLHRVEALTLKVVYSHWRV